MIYFPPAGVIAYSIGIAWAAQDELEAVATDPDKEHSFFVDEFDRLYRFVSKIVQNICTEFNSQPRNWLHPATRVASLKLHPINQAMPDEKFYLKDNFRFALQA